MEIDNENAKKDCKKLSVIVPVYNTESYLARCVESLLRIKVCDYEILLVDDGSTDHSGDICDQYAIRYDFIRVIHKRNGGIVSARKSGVKHAKGKYIAFVDSDDWVGENVFTDFVSFLDKDDVLDVCIGGLRRVYSNEIEYPICGEYPIDLMTNVDGMKEMLRWKKFHWELCGNLYRKVLFSGFNPPEEVGIGEDLISNFFLLKRARKVLYAPINQYYYFANLTSMTQSEEGDMQSLILPFFYMNQHDIEEGELNALIKTLYIREIIKDIWYKIFSGDGFAERVPFYRNELEKIISDKGAYLFIKQHFYVKSFHESLEDNSKFYSFWMSLSNKISIDMRFGTDCYKNVYVYGTGVISKFITKILKRDNIKYVAYVVSDGHWKKNKNVKFLSELSDENKDTIFILALASVYHSEVIDELHKKGYTNFLSFDVISSLYR